MSIFHKHVWEWQERRTDIHGKARDIYKCSGCGATEERPA